MVDERMVRDILADVKEKLIKITGIEERIRKIAGIADKYGVKVYYDSKEDEVYGSKPIHDSASISTAKTIYDIISRMHGGPNADIINVSIVVREKAPWHIKKTMKRIELGDRTVYYDSFIPYAFIYIPIEEGEGVAYIEIQSEMPIDP